MTRRILLPKLRLKVARDCMRWGAAIMLAASIGCTGNDQPSQNQITKAALPETQAPSTVEPRTPVAHKAGYRASVEGPASMPPVLLSKQHQAMCRIGVGDTLPPLELSQLGGRRTKLTDLYGSTATVIVFWKSGQRMSVMELTDLGPDVVEQFGGQGVAVVGIAVNESARSAQSVLAEADATFPNLLDAGGQAFAQVGSQKLPRIYLVDPHGKILWFDIEYSLATRRELNQALRAVVQQ